MLSSAENGLFPMFFALSCVIWCCPHRGKNRGIFDITGVKNGVKMGDSPKRKTPCISTRRSANILDYFMLSGLLASKLCVYPLHCSFSVLSRYSALYWHPYAPWWTGYTLCHPCCSLLPRSRITSNRRNDEMCAALLSRSCPHSVYCSLLWSVAAGVP